VEVGCTVADSHPLALLQPSPVQSVRCRSLPECCAVDRTEFPIMFTFVLRRLTGRRKGERLVNGAALKM
jgi:hypothetical protein